MTATERRSRALPAPPVEPDPIPTGGAAVHPVPARIDREVGRLKLAALGVEIDEPTLEQEHYRESWG